MLLLEMEQDFKEYLEDRYYSKNTIKTYLYNFKKFCTDMKISTVDQLSSKTFNEYKEHLENRKIKGQTINTKFEAIRSFLKFLYLRKQILAPTVEERDRGIKIRLPEIKVRIYDRFYKKELTIREIKRILREIDKDTNNFYRLRNKILIQILATTGVRISEALQLNIDDVISGRVEVVGKRNKIRTVLIAHSISKLCREFRRCRKEMYLTNEKLFISTQDKEVTARALATNLERVGKLAKVKRSKLFFHNFRHFYTVDSIKNGMDLNTLAQNLGIENMEVLKIYQSRDIKTMQQEVNKRGRRLFV